MKLLFTGIARSFLVLAAVAAAWLAASPARAATDTPGEATTAGALASHHQRAMEELRYVEYEAYLERRCQGEEKTERITIIGQINLDGWSRTISHIVAGTDGSAKMSVEYFTRDSIPFRQIVVDSLLYPDDTHVNPEPQTASLDVFMSEAPLHPSYVFTAFIDSATAMHQEPNTFDAARCTPYDSTADQSLMTICVDSRTGLARDVRIEQQDGPATGACRLSAHAAYIPVAGPPAVEPPVAILDLYKKETRKARLEPDAKPVTPEQTVPGVCIFPDKPTSVELFSPANGLPDAPVTAMIFDVSGALWAGTRKGIARRSAGDWNTFTAGGKLFGTHVTDFLLRPDGALWAATSSGIHTYDGKRWDVITTRNGLPDNNVMCLAASPDGRDVWAGTMRGLGHLRNGVWRTYTTLDGLPDNDVTALSIDSNGTLWAGTVKGLVRFSNGRFLDSGDGSPVADQFIKVLSATPDGKIWVIAGTLPGMVAGNTAHWAGHTGSGGLPCAHVSHVTADRNGCVWAACLDILDTSPALIYYDGLKWHTFTQGAGDHPYLLTPAPDGSLWAATARGIMHIIF